jgi:lipopolysaccharide/colanic/teichoic acid biosynthesis glycosyltransferase
VKAKLTESPYHNSFQKQLFDIGLSFLGLIILSPLFLISAILIKLASKGPVFFVQNRTGKNGKVFRMIMFRTMKVGAERLQKRYLHLNEADGPVFKIKNDPRFVGIGKFLSRTGFNETPQFINVIRGEMSLVGPRPFPVKEAKKLTRTQKVRELIKPGITSSWVVEGSHSMKFNKWMQLDRNYVLKASLSKDFSIIYKTIMLIYDSTKLSHGTKRNKKKPNRKPKHGWGDLIDNRIIYPIYNLFNKYLINRIIYHYGADYRWNDQKSQNLDKKHSNLGYGYIHHAIIRNQRPERVLCIGSMYGFIPFMMAKACMENRKGKVDFVDAGYDIRDEKDKGKHNYGQGFWKRKNAKNHFKYLSTNKYIELYVMTAGEFAKKRSYKYDYIYLDGDHRYKEAKKTFELFWPRLKEGGFVCLHDIHFQVFAKGVRFEHWKLWEELLDKSLFKIELSNHYSGLGFIQKITKPRKRYKKKFD